MTSKTIHTSTGTATITEGEVITMYVGQRATPAEVISVSGGAFQLKYVGDAKPFHILGSVLARALTPWRVPLEQLTNKRR